MPVRDPQPILRLAEPPAGYSFRAGVWLTHDLAWEDVCALLAPTLAGVTTTGERRIQETRAAVGNNVPGLVVLHAGAPTFESEGPVLPWATALAITGRRQHAKAAVLQFVKGKRTRTRALVTSANLTSGGLRTNWEVVAWDEQGVGAGPFLAVDLLREIRKLVKELPSDSRLDTVLRALQGPLRGRPSTNELFSSLGESQPLWRAPVKDPPVQRIVVVSPGFAGNADTETAAILARWCDNGTVVDLYTGYEGTRAAARAASSGLVLSAGLRRGLEKAAAVVQLHAVPAVDDDGTNARRLHAKAYAFVTTGGRVECFVGSANCTGPGLGGRNRELLVRTWISVRDLDRFLDGLGAVDFGGTITPPPAKVPSVDVPEQPPVVAEFVIAAGAWPDAPLWDGMMTISGVPADATATYLGKRLVPPGPIEMALDPRVGFVEVRRQGRLWNYLIRVEAPLGDAGFWERLPDEKAVDRPDRSLEQFLADVRLAASRRGKSGKTGLTGTSGDDQFSIPAEQLLVRLARHRRSLARLPAITISRALLRLLRNEPSEALAVASAIKAAYHPELGSRSDTLLKALTSSIASFDALGGDDGPKQD